MPNFETGRSRWGTGVAFDREAESEPEASRLYQQAYMQGWRKGLWSRIRRRSRNLLHLRSAQSSYSIVSRRDGGVQTISISRIRGSEGRSDDFDIDFNPLTALTEYRWRSVATAWYRGAVLPPISVIQVGDIYFVQDGHHRVSVARALGQSEIEARITVWHVAGSSTGEQLSGTNGLPLAA